MSNAKQFFVGQLVRPKGDDLRNAFFRVLAVTSNGWAKCIGVALADGRRLTRDESNPNPYPFTPKFRTSHLKIVDQLPPQP